MSRVLKISDAASLALHTMALLTNRPGELLTVQEIARELPVSQTHLAKVLQRLAKQGLVRSVRGPKGGFTLNCPPESLSLLTIFEAIEGPMDPTDCLFGTPICNFNACILGDLVQQVEGQIRQRLSSTKLSDLGELRRVKSSTGRAQQEGPPPPEPTRGSPDQQGRTPGNE